ncbi:T9SS type A sorting domain-containing protein [Hymenobacter sp. APR13]|uniref:T9SS type A sorting domain-containing protein n=1 Tax=Hymenobacter sp. APR13 TaxID=1356852 RepID=UPI0004E093CC|nr:T9SS type A sorting domain-containing protein [Hymenobacter sp. APR13]AII52277.1 hypothetical protein N008_09835 [Hymenobacter sp. APR13]
MKKSYLILMFMLLGSATQALAQYEFKDNVGANTNGLGPYSQNFDGLAGTNATFTSNTTIKGVYTRYTLDGVGAEFESKERPLFTNNQFTGISSTSTIPSDDGAKGAEVNPQGQPTGAGWYHFGTSGSSDRALGGIAATNTSSGKGYIGIRLKNTSTKVIKKLEVEYAMEQWYNSSNTQAAFVEVAWKKNLGDIPAASPNALYLSTTTGWTTEAALRVDAPSTSTAIAPRNGNAPTNRRVLRTTLTNLELGIGEEIMIRWGYVFNTSTNGNGLSIDDVVITPQTNIFYSADADNKNLDNKNSWGVNADGTGTAPTDFNQPNCTYYVRGTSATADRIANNWTVGGLNSKIIVGGDAGTAATFRVAANDALAATVDVGPGSTLILESTSNPTLVLGALNKSSTVVYSNDGTTEQTVKGGVYGNVQLKGVGPKALAGNMLVSTGFAFAATGTTTLTLNAYDVTLQKGAAITGTAGVFVTNNTGSLKQTVTNTGVGVLFPVGTSATAYNPVTLSQTATQSEDTYSVRVGNGVFAQYSDAGVGSSPVLLKTVQKTWFVAEEVLGNSNITMKLQWNNVTDVTSDFVAAAAHINHYLNGGWDQSYAEQAPALVSANVYAQSRTGITSFSPFGVSSRPGGVLPVTLTAFAATRTPKAVRCDWKTASELNNDYFVVERSANGREFEGIGTVAGRGTTSQASSYSYLDQQPLDGLAYYRLRQTDLDGTYHYSPIVAVTGCTTCADVLQTLALAPNPSTGIFRVLDAGGQPVAVTGTVHNTLGKVMQQLNGHSTVDLQAQPAGIYLLKLDAAHGAKVLRVVKE